MNRQRGFDLVEVLIVLAIVAIIVASVAGAIAASEEAEQERTQWLAFAIESDCRVVERTARQSSTSTGWGTMSNGKSGMVTTTNTTPAMSKWLCSDGVAYWRKTSDGPSIDSKPER